MARNYNKGTYDGMIQKQGAKAGEGMRGLANIAAMAGNEVNLEQGHGELTESYRAPIHPGHSANRDDLRQADYIGKERALNPTY